MAESRDLSLPCSKCGEFGFEAVRGFVVAAAGGMTNPLLYYRCIACQQKADGGQMLMAVNLKRQQEKLEVMREQAEAALEGMQTSAEALALRGETPEPELPPEPTPDVFNYEESQATNTNE